MGALVGVSSVHRELTWDMTFNSDWAGDYAVVLVPWSFGNLRLIPRAFVRYEQYVLRGKQVFQEKGPLRPKLNHSILNAIRRVDSA